MTCFKNTFLKNKLLKGNLLYDGSALILTQRKISAIYKFPNRSSCIRELENLKRIEDRLNTS